MSELILQPSNQHVARLAHEGEPVRAVIELVWNAIDAEAWKVSVSLTRANKLGAIASIGIADNGHGISPDEVRSSFRWIGSSWKKRGQLSRNKVRRMHGHRGEGRLRAFSLGDRIEWSSRSRDTAQVMHEVKISATRNDRTRFTFNVVSAPDGNPGTAFSAWNDSQRSLGRLEPKTAVPQLRSEFAPLLLSNPKLTITYDGVDLDPSQEIVGDTNYDLGPVGRKNKSLSLRIIEWRTSDQRHIYYGARAEQPLHDEEGKGAEPQFYYSAYATWPEMGDDAHALTFERDAPEPLNDIWSRTHRAIREHFARVRRTKRRDRLAEWKDTGVYPYRNPPENESEEVERALFDVVSGALGDQVSSIEPAARLTLGLLKNAVHESPEQLATVLHEITSLSTTDLDELTGLLRETSLTSIIRSASLVARRNRFLIALDNLLFDEIDSANIAEKANLHRLLERELWVLGEGYNAMNSERGFTELLRTHLKLSGLPTKGVRPVTLLDGKGARVDLHFAVRAREHDRVRNLIVELKSPDVHVGAEELRQVEKYAAVLRYDDRFADPNARWDLVLVANKLDDVARDSIHKEERELGKFWGPPPRDGGPVVNAYVRQWSEVISENRQRLLFLTNALEHDPGIAESLEWVRSEHGDVLPVASDRSSA